MKKGFISYSHEDTKWKELILKSLPNEIRQYIWADFAIKPGEVWRDEINNEITQSDVAILLISQAFINSEFINRHELPDLLKKAQDKLGFHLLVIACKPFNPDKLSSVLKYQWVWGPDNVLSALNSHNRGAALVKIAQKIEAALNDPSASTDYTDDDPKVASSNPSASTYKLESRDDVGTALHILTGGKGGVGKTLLGLSAFLVYAFKLQRPIHGLDLNSMNTDLYRLLSFQKIRDVHANWRTAQTEGHAQVSRLNESYILPEGISGFWRRILDPLRNPDYYHDNIVVDTNLHIANLYMGNPTPYEAINELIKKTQKTIYLWIVWTYASVSDYRSVNKAIRHFHGDYDNRIKIIHVLNPGALMPPTFNIDRFIDGINQLVELRSTNQQFESTITMLENDMQTQEKNSFYQAAIDNLAKIISAHVAEMDEKLRDLQQQPGQELTKGLKQLWHLPTIPYSQDNDEAFGSILSDHLTRFQPENFMSLYEAIEQRFKGRPINVLPITSHDTSFIGYTEQENIGKSLDEIRARLHSVYDDVEKFLIQLL